MIGRTFSHYRVIERLGAGGMGEVYKAHAQHLDRDVAIKVLPPGTLDDEEARRRFRREAKALSRLNHSHIATPSRPRDGIAYALRAATTGPPDSFAVNGSSIALWGASSTLALVGAEEAARLDDRYVRILATARAEFESTVFTFPL
jgi:protein kinase-like protein